jgi:hypothetical protein
MLEAMRQLSQSTIPGRTIIRATGITGRSAVAAIWEASVVLTVAVMAAAGIGDRNS